MAQKSLYDVLLVDQNATLDEIKLAFKRRALQVHPDKGGSKEEFHLVYQALETLGDPAARQEYDHSLATTKTGRAPHAPHPKNKKRKREEKPAHPATSCKAKPQAKQKMPQKKSTTSAGKAPSKPAQATATAMPAEPQSPQTELLMKIRDLLKRLPREMRKDVITNHLSQKQRILLEKFMVDNAGPSSTQGHSEVKVLAPAAGKSAPNQPGFDSETSPRESPQRTVDLSNESCLVISPATDSAEVNKGPARKMKAKDKKEFNAKARSTGSVFRAKWHSSLYVASIGFDSLEMRTGKKCDLKTALEDLMILTSVKQKMRNHTFAGTFVERLQAAVVSSAAEHARDFKDLKLVFRLLQCAGCFFGGDLRSPTVRSIELFGKMRSVLEPFRQYANQIGGQTSIYWRYSPVHLEDAWGRFQLAVVEAWEIAGVDGTAILQKIRSRYENRAPLRSASLHLWERQHMAMEDKNGNRPWRLREKNPTGRLECWERRQMAMEDRNEHRPKKLQQRNPTRHFVLAEQCRRAMEDNNRHRLKKLRQKLDLRKCTSESALSRQLSSLRKLIARWGHMLKRECELLDQQRQRVLHQRRAQQKKDQEERRRVEVLNEKTRREAERSR